MGAIFDDPIRIGDRWHFPDGATLPVVAGGEGPRDSGNATDAMIRRLEDELEERNTFVQGLVAGAQDAGRDLSSQEMELIASAQNRIGQVSDQLTPLRETSRITIESRNRAREINNEIQNARRRGGVGPVEYRSAGEYIADFYAWRMGDRDAAERIEVFHRAAAHQTTADNPGLLPESIVEPVVNFVDSSRPLVTAIGPRDLGIGSWAYARVTQHTEVAQQAAEKTEMASRKMIITKTPIAAPTYGGYVNISRQDIRRTSPGIVNMVIDDLASEYAIETEAAAAGDLQTAATPGTVTYPANPTSADVSKAIWGAVGQAWAGTRGQGRSILAVAPDMLALVGPLFPNVNPTNALGQGFDAANFGQGPQGTVSGLVAVMSAGLSAGMMLVVSSAAVRCFEDRYGAMQVDEPSVLGVQVGYAGDFETVVIEATGVVSIVQGV
jgi:HK97 family phage major capsid protein